MKNIGSLVFSFFVGGLVVAGVKYLSSNTDNPGLAAILGGLPTGLLVMYLVTRPDSVTYSHNYFFNTLILAAAIMTFYLMAIYTQLNKNLALTISIGIWVALVTINYMISKKK